ncbi:DUF4384 domain-containing protein [Pseudogemmatithrix spongiicola]|uniref:DUF4384 domain-containing protein n=1 Tax=Pseudogemmatithrix spongiicola TaxID=3062599 RepID=A0AA49JYY4_9BACT|nr:DUF4384 domain-containing protein [Gemmatimonadaceae bacterium 'strain 138']WKW14408.1 DUF4384 domain-containing protein [Gemmatimonadaceae bacterium 'strain 318']
MPTAERRGCALSRCLHRVLFTAAASTAVLSLACSSPPAARPAPAAAPAADPWPASSGQPRSASCGPTLEQEWQRIRLARFVPADRSRAQMEQVLLSEARVLAVQQAVGITIATTTSRAQYEAMANGESREYRDHFFELYSQDAAGVIVEERHRAARPHADSITVFYEARVACDAGTEAAGLTASVSTDQLVYREGDGIRITAEASDATRLYLFSVLQDGSAWLIFPNQADSSNRLAPGTRRSIPRPGANYELKAQLEPRFGAAQSELLFAIFYTGDGPAPFRAQDAFTAKFSLEQINRVLLRIPRAERSRAVAGYEIRAR